MRRVSFLLEATSKKTVSMRRPASAAAAPSPTKPPEVQKVTTGPNQTKIADTSTQE